MIKHINVTITVILIICSFVGCKSVSSSRFEKQSDVRKEEQSSLISVAGAISGKELTDEDLKNLGKQLRTSEEAKSAVEIITNSLSGNNKIKYCPIDGKRYGPNLEKCPDHNVLLKELEEFDK